MTVSAPIYMDYLATTPVDPRVATVVLEAVTNLFGNPSSVDHGFGDEAAGLVDRAKEQVAGLVGTSARNIVFTSGATESLNLVLRSLAETDGGRRRFAVSPLEHRAVLDTCAALARRGLVDVEFIEVNSRGELISDDIERICRTKPALLCAMAANNEIGNIYPVATWGAIAAEHGVPYLCDATQAVGKVPLHVDQDQITYMACSAHKLYGPKGTGALIIQRGANLIPQLTGGSQQRGLRAGTLNTSGIAGLGEASRLRAEEMISDEETIAERRDQLEGRLKSAFPELAVHGTPEARLSGCLSMAVPGVPNGAVIARIRRQLAISTGAACSSGVEAPSHVLRAMGLQDELLEATLRISIGKPTTEDEIAVAADLLIQAISDVRKRVMRV